LPEDTAHSADTLPEPMDVVWCHFPYDERRWAPGPTPHPCLVFETREFRPGEYAVQVVFGTSNIARADRDTNFLVSNYGAQILAGLCKETLFDLGRSRRLEWRSRWFTTPDPKRWSTPIIGRIPDQGHDVLRMLIAKRRALGLPVP
jgi:hypothetical protein